MAVAHFNFSLQPGYEPGENTRISHKMPDLFHSIAKNISAHRANLGTFSFLVIANVIVAGIGWLTQVKIANTLGREVFGQVAFAMTLGVFGQTFIRFGFDRTLVRDLIHYPQKRAILIEASLFLRYFLVIVLVIFLFAWKILHIKTTVSWGMMLITLATALLALDLQPVYDVLQTIKTHTAYFLFQKSLYFLLIWSVIAAIGTRFLSISWIGAALMASVLIYLMMQFRWVKTRLSLTMTYTPAVWENIRWLIRSSWLAWVTAFAGLAMVMLNQLVLKKYAGFAELGGYAAGWQLVLIGTLFLDQMSRIGRPAMARATLPGVSRARKIRFIVKYFLMTFLIVTPLVSVMCFFPDYMFRTIFKPEYLKFAFVLPIMGFYILLCSLDTVTFQYVISARLDKIYFWSVITGGTASVILSFTLIPQYGIAGAAWALLLSHGTTIIIYTIGMIVHVCRQN